MPPRSERRGRGRGFLNTGINRASIAKAAESAGINPNITVNTVNHALPPEFAGKKAEPSLPAAAAAGTRSAAASNASKTVSSAHFAEFDNFTYLCFWTSVLFPESEGEFAPLSFFNPFNRFFSARSARISSGFPSASRLQPTRARRPVRPFESSNAFRTTVCSDADVRSEISAAALR